LPVAFSCANRVSIDHMRHVKRLEGMFWRLALEMKQHQRKITTLALPRDEGLTRQLIALQDVFTILGVRKMSSSCFATVSVFDLKSHPKTGMRER